MSTTIDQLKINGEDYVPDPGDLERFRILIVALQALDMRVRERRFYFEFARSHAFNHLPRRRFVLRSPEGAVRPHFWHKPTPKVSESLVSKLEEEYRARRQIQSAKHLLSTVQFGICLCIVWFAILGRKIGLAAALSELGAVVLLLSVISVALWLIAKRRKGRWVRQAARSIVVASILSVAATKVGVALALNSRELDESLGYSFAVLGAFAISVGRLGRRTFGTLILGLAMLYISADHNLHIRTTMAGWAALAITAILGIHSAFHAERDRRRFWLVNYEHDLETAIARIVSEEATHEAVDAKYEAAVARQALGDTDT